MGEISLSVVPPAMPSSGIAVGVADGLFAGARNGAAGAPPPPDPGLVKAAVANANQALAQNGTQLTFVFDDQIHETIVKIVDVQTHQVVQQIPSEAMLAAARALSGTKTSGALVDTKA